MNLERLVAKLEQFPKTLSAMVTVLSDDEARWKPPSGAWSVLEVVCHLADEEVDDFRTRVRLMQEDPAAPWPGIDPEGWARARAYTNKNLRAELDRFARERAESVRWLRSRGSWDWAVSALRPHGPIRAGDLMVSWAAHDALHARQIAKRMYELAGEDGRPEGFSTRYAGEWGV
ncbi:MAG: DinB family protein [Phycisphaerales bacterium]|nr:DinB family protein [Phycisphaerales bacterium]